MKTGDRIKEKENGMGVITGQLPVRKDLGQVQQILKHPMMNRMTDIEKQQLTRLIFTTKSKNMWIVAFDNGKSGVYQPEQLTLLIYTNQ